MAIADIEKSTESLDVTLTGLKLNKVGDIPLI